VAYRTPWWILAQTWQERGIRWKSGTRPCGTRNNKQTNNRHLALWDQTFAKQVKRVFANNISVFAKNVSGFFFLGGGPGGGIGFWVFTCCSCTHDVFTNFATLKKLHHLSLLKCTLS
jgi:hypothetical protein